MAFCSILHWRSLLFPSTSAVAGECAEGSSLKGRCSPTKHYWQPSMAQFPWLFIRSYSLRTCEHALAHADSALEFTDNEKPP